ncbi:DNA-processing protein DprA [Colwellia asteriadis]|uniref:DNA-processing protein DprA n=1 Tax=Colwellia asteriadis TaxID=517723 RepID=A0ABN1L7L6_9GAMM
MTKTTTHYWLALKLVPRLATHKKLTLVNDYGLQSLFASSSKSSPLTSAHGLSATHLSAFNYPNWSKVNEIIEQSGNANADIISFDDAYYPAQLKQIYDPPLVLFTKGNTSLLNLQQVAIVGSRFSTIKGRETAFDFAQQLTKKNYIVNSGLAIGIDAAAHQGVLAIQGKTIAVVATGVDIVYPTRHRDLASEILQNDGLIVSEFYPATQPRAGHFPKRNRLISGLSEGVVVVEAELKSGSLITARCALEQNREVFAVPSSIDNPQAKGCHWLIKQGAKLVENSADIIDELMEMTESSLYSKESNSTYVNTKQPKVVIASKKPNEKSPSKDLCNDNLLASVGYEITPIDKVVSRSELPVEEVITRLTMLELSGLITAVPGGYIRV